MHLYSVCKGQSHCLMTAQMAEDIPPSARSRHLSGSGAASIPSLEEGHETVLLLEAGRLAPRIGLATHRTNTCSRSASEGIAELARIV